MSKRAHAAVSYVGVGDEPMDIGHIYILSRVQHGGLCTLLDMDGRKSIWLESLLDMYLDFYEFP